MTPYAAIQMPPRAPLALTQQDFGDRPEPRRKFRSSWPDRLWRMAAFGPALLVTISLMVGFFDWFQAGGVTLTETVAVALIGLTFVWVSLSVSSVMVGLVRLIFARRPLRQSRVPHDPQTVALLVPVYNEAPEDVFGNLQAMLKELAQKQSRDRYCAFILSDTFDPVIAKQEEQAFAALLQQAPAAIDVYYRRRLKNTDKKVGNISDWLENWGGAFDAMVVLDADSLMSGSAIRHLTRALASDPEAGLIQSFPMVIGSETLFGRIQQFSNTIYGWLLAEGLSAWSQREGNYWGHNAIIRTRAFAESAALPYLRSWRGRESLILSHDFVEAGMLRRAGWAVRFLPHVGGSFEEAPQTLIDYALRDRRWCQGNLQHLRLLSARGFHPITRFHLLQGAVAFLLSPAWLALIAIWAMIGMHSDAAEGYFNAANPLYPIWPQTEQMGGGGFLIFIYAMLLIPKLSSMVALGLNPRVRQNYGGLLSFVASVLVEIILSILYAPILMVQQSIAVLRALLGRGGWSPQSRGAAGYGVAMTLRFHMLETGLGLAMFWGMQTGALSFWLVPIATSLTCAVPLSLLSGARIANGPVRALRLDTPHSLNEPRIMTAARAERQVLRDHLQGSVITPAE
ncbi:glucosyltransferase MdoH [Actibacterium atlanticum]|uniref:Glucans biosynthesis glucosyltransferase H n=1 Tax=Actibacterium atlanticum TaxID=1461693 RepID=A0A058ZKP3_9RHOB|nr:glucans biosynthesis glucosyltransferase MdoH [Actibacterium atlanticum]KCV82138.1 glucosyltransferase MdoH [Actibacterium atlanticum]